MTLNASLKSRVRRLEQMQVNGRFDVAKALDAMRRRHDAMTPAQQAVEYVQLWDLDMEALLSGAPDPDWDHEWPPRDVEVWEVSFRRKRALVEIDQLVALDEPDAQAPVPNDCSEANVRLLWAWQSQQNRRARARDFLQQVERARGLYTPRHWPLSAALLEMSR